MDRGWGGLPMMFPSKTAMDYLWHRTDILPEEDIAPGAHYRARRAMLDNVRGYKEVKRGLQRRIHNIEMERRRARMPESFISTSGVSKEEYRSPFFRKKIQIGNTEPRHEKTLGLMDVRRRMFKNPSEQCRP